ncbi:hypothetical protein GCM10007384_02890 [Aquimarina muelleri]|uniref:Uncharacterized protein n=1 Tax=Aquimarina muelleri TaxID=279356 RepID=A0A918JUH2_9FLAO|nr:hypothetical protein GCM10007384_02890 [Aquimarina muelleri]
MYRFEGSLGCPLAHKLTLRSDNFWAKGLCKKGKSDMFWGLAPYKGGSNYLSHPSKGVNDPYKDLGNNYTPCLYRKKYSTE